LLLGKTKIDLIHRKPWTNDRGEGICSITGRVENWKAGNQKRKSPEEVEGGFLNTRKEGGKPKQERGALANGGGRPRIRGG